MYNDKMDWTTKLKNEFVNAEKARERKNEGQARVCARRAAGIAIREYFIYEGTQVHSTSAYDLIEQLKDEPALPSDLKLVADHLTLRVTEEFKLPIDADLIAESKALCDWLEKQMNPKDD